MEILIDMTKKSIHLLLKKIIKYIFFGVLTTLINIGVYTYLRYETLLHYQICIVISWFIAVLFAFITNKAYVFESRSWQFRIVLKEGFLFYFYRVLSLVMEMIFMFLFVDQLQYSEFISKVGVQLLIIVLNYIFSQWFIFRSKSSSKES